MRVFTLDLASNLEPDGVIPKDVRVVDLAQKLSFPQNLLEVFLKVVTMLTRFQPDLFDSIQLTIKTVPCPIDCAEAALANLLNFFEIIDVSLSYLMGFYSYVAQTTEVKAQHQTLLIMNLYKLKSKIEEIYYYTPKLSKCPPTHKIVTLLHHLRIFLV